MKSKIQIGDYAKDSITGFEGVVTQTTEYLNLDRQIGIQFKCLKDGLPHAIQWFPEHSVVNNITIEGNRIQFKVER